MNLKNILSRSVLLHSRRALGALVLGSALVLTVSGCVAIAAAGAAGAGVAWVRGALETQVDASLDRTYVAAQRAVRELEFASISDRKSGVDALVVARTALDKKIEVELKRVGEKSTRVSIRVGVFGDEALSLRILEQIKAGL